MTDEKLIEEAAATIAVSELVRTHRTWGDLIEPQKDEYRRVARATLAVFEKAHTPTEDEREALLAILDNRLGICICQSYVGERHDRMPACPRVKLADDVAAGFRRSEVPEQSDKGFCDQCSGPFLAKESESNRWLEEGYGGHWDTCPNRVDHSAPEPQEEPSDADLGRVAWEAVHEHGAFRRDFPDVEYFEAVGVSVRAAGGVR